MFEDYYQKLLEKSLEPNFKDIPLSHCVPMTGKICISFSLYEPIEFLDENFDKNTSLLAEVCNILSHASQENWDFYHPNLIYKPNNKTISAEFFVKKKEEVKQLSYQEKLITDEE